MQAKRAQPLKRFQDAAAAALTDGIGRHELDHAFVADVHRFIDHLAAIPDHPPGEAGEVSMDDIRREADRMVDMGFAPDLTRILRKLPASRQTLMFSATIPPELNTIAKKTLVEPIRVDVAPRVTTCEFPYHSAIAPNGPSCT